MRIKDEVGAPLNRFKPSSKIFTDRSKAVLFCGSFLCFFLPCGHLLEKN